MQKPRVLAPLVLLLFACASSYDPRPMNRAAESYVKLVLAAGEHDADYVDAYYGPPEWRASIKEKRPSLAEIRHGAAALRDEVTAMAVPRDAMERLRRQYLIRQTEALISRVEILEGKKLKFDDESKALYDAV